MEILAYIHLACSYEASQASDPVADPSNSEDFLGLNRKKLYNRAWMPVLSVLIASTIVGIPTQVRANLTQGSTGSAVSDIQQQLRELGYFNRPATGNFGPLTKEAVVRFQQDEGLTPDGVVETKTKTALLRRLGRNDQDANSPDANSADPVRRIKLKRGSNGSEVEALQKLLTAAGVYDGEVNGKFDAKTQTSVRLFQRNNRLTVDGVVGPRTWSALLDTSGTTATGPFNKEPFTEGETPPVAGNSNSADGNSADSNSADSNSADSNSADSNSADSNRANVAILKQGSKGSQVRALQRRLRDLGYFKGRTTGNFGSLTKAAITRFQQDSGLTANGIVDEATQVALFPKTDSSNQSTPNQPAPNQSTPTEATNQLSVRELQQRLKEKGFYNGPVDGNLSPQTKEAIKSAQQAYGVGEDDILNSRF